MEGKTVKFTYHPSMVCSEAMIIEIEGTRLKSLEVIGGCPGNLKGISRLVVGMDIDEIIERLEGITCGRKPTSCPDQLAQALKQFKAEQQKA